ncbi:hypothetical protein [Anabaena sp. CCY 9402-a]|uniref:hypothetical protein n=1 Tax=Anabaena sp. CCY 9402-a TaxID=3103867 RepID=UPI0039C66300
MRSRSVPKESVSVGDVTAAIHRVSQDQFLAPVTLTVPSFSMGDQLRWAVTPSRKYSKTSPEQRSLKVFW